MTHRVVMKLQLGLKIRWNVIIESYLLFTIHNSCTIDRWHKSYGLQIMTHMISFPNCCACVLKCGVNILYQNNILSYYFGIQTQKHTRKSKLRVLCDSHLFKGATQALLQVQHRQRAVLPLVCDAS